MVAEDGTEATDQVRMIMMLVCLSQLVLLPLEMQEYRITSGLCRGAVLFALRLDMERSGLRSRLWLLMA